MKTELSYQDYERKKRSLQKSISELYSIRSQYAPDRPIQKSISDMISAHLSTLKELEELFKPKEIVYDPEEWV